MKAALLWAVWALVDAVALRVCTWADALQVEMLLARAERQIAQRRRMAGKGERP